MNNFLQANIATALRCLLLFLAWLFCLTTTSCSNKTPSLPQLAPNSVVVAFGDSLTYGSGVKANESYPAVLQSLTRFTVINEGVPGELSEAGLLRLADVLDEHEPNLLILCHGGNDLLRKKNKNSLKENLKKMVSMAQSRDISVVLLGVPEPKLVFMESEELYLKVAEQFGVPVEMDILPKIEGNNSLKSDAIHPNAKGYRLMAEAILALLVKSGSIQVNR